ncbi:cupin domain-containing protein [Actinomadura parmotrematis]|uniref:Cupin domain-containing protein n=1 Tax=Actinomadura parmotrematis TaxID=2864039 RepID=A0ABS7FV48_9ACTN|nr:cupin domain-containing protein [Actinomadura parmotrematis]MBW8484278.1 cupin domain-containing protein [Actinomadura parmotrematis]
MTTPRIAAARLVVQDLAAATAEPDGASAALSTAHTVLHESGPLEIGVWEAGPGTDTDVEADEVFLVLAGTGTVTFDDGSVLTLNPGALVHLRAGDRTTWHLTTRLRKLYLTGLPTEA